MDFEVKDIINELDATKDAFHNESPEEPDGCRDVNKLGDLDNNLLENEVKRSPAPSLSLSLSLSFSLFLSIYLSFYFCIYFPFFLTTSLSIHLCLYLSLCILEYYDEFECRYNNL